MDSILHRPHYRAAVANFDAHPCSRFNVGWHRQRGTGDQPVDMFVHQPNKRRRKRRRRRRRRRAEDRGGKAQGKDARRCPARGGGRPTATLGANALCRACADPSGRRAPADERKRPGAERAVGCAAVAQVAPRPMRLSRHLCRTNQLKSAAKLKPGHPSPSPATAVRSSLAHTALMCRSRFPS